MTSSATRAQFLNLKDREEYVLARLLHDAGFIDYANQVLLPGDWQSVNALALYKAIQEAHRSTGSAPSAVEIMAVADSLGLTERLKNAGGDGYIQRIGALQVSEDMARQFIWDLQTAARALARLGEELKELATSGQGDVIALAEEKMQALAGRRSPIAWASAGEVVDNILASISGEKPLDDALSFSGISALDGPVVGFQPGRVVTLATLSHMGKTVVALNAAAGFAAAGAAVLYFAYEQEERELGRMLLSSRTGPHMPWILERPEPKKRLCLTPRRVQLLELSPQKRAQAISAAHKYGQNDVNILLTPDEQLELANAALHVRRMTITFDTARLGIAYMRSAIRRFTRLYPNTFVWAFLDYFQIARDDKPSRRTKADELADMSRQIKLSAGTDLDGRGSWWVNAQFNREADRALAQSPADSLPLEIYNQYMLKDSGSCEQEADVILFGHRADRHPKRVNLARGKAWSQIDFGFAKNRPTGIITNTTAWMNMLNLSVTDEQYPIHSISAADSIAGPGAGNQKGTQP